MWLFFQSIVQTSSRSLSLFSLRNLLNILKYQPTKRLRNLVFACQPSRRSVADTELSGNTCLFAFIHQLDDNFPAHLCSTAYYCNLIFWSRIHLDISLLRECICTLYPTAGQLVPARVLLQACGVQMLTRVATLCGYFCTTHTHKTLSIDL